MKKNERLIDKKFPKTKTFEEVIPPEPHTSLFLTMEEIISKKWFILILNGILCLTTTMIIDSPIFIQLSLTKSLQYSNLTFLLIFATSNLVGCFSRKIINNLRKRYSNKTALLVCYFLTIIGQAIFVISFKINSIVLMIIGRIVVSFNSEPFSILSTSQISKIFGMNYGKIPYNVLISSSFFGNMINAFMLPHILKESNVIESNFYYLILSLFISVIILPIYIFDYYFDLNQKNIEKLKSSLAGKNIKEKRRILDFPIIYEENPYKIFDFKGYFKIFLDFPKEFYLIIIAGSLLYTQIYTLIYLYSGIIQSRYGSNSVEAGFFIGKFFVMTIFFKFLNENLFKIYKSKLDLLILSGFCGIIVHLMILGLVNLELIMILNSFEFALIINVLHECLPLIVDQQKLSNSYEINKIIQFSLICVSCIIFGIITDLVKWNYLIQNVILIVLNLISMKLFFYAKKLYLNL